MFLKPLVLTLAAAWAVAASAQPPGDDNAATPAKPEHRPSGMAVYRTCKPDFKLYCPHTSAGSSQQKQCVHENFEKLGPDCQAILKRYESQAAK